ncbi:hypothetical protein AgCh_007513 [Apium graveolens]
MMDRVEEQVKLLKKAVVDLLLSHLELQQQRLLNLVPSDLCADLKIRGMGFWDFVFMGLWLRKGGEKGEFGVRVDAVSLVNVLPACGVEKVWRRGKEVHGYAVRSGLSEDVYVGNAIVDMNAKCELMDDVGRFEDALSLFEMIKVEKRFGIDGKLNRKIGEDGFWLRLGDFCSDFS